MQLEIEVIKNGYTGTILRVFGSPRWAFTLTDVQCAALKNFCTAPALGMYDNIAFSAGHKSGVEFAYCHDDKFTVLFTVNEEVEGVLIDKEQVRAIGELL